MDKQAYLIIAHNNFEILEKTLTILDDERNDFYIHIDKKVKNFDFNRMKNIVKKSEIIFTERIDVKWGHSSQIECELILLKKAYNKKYSYYHLLSGVDMPIKSKNEIYNFFQKNKGKEFINFQDKVCKESLKNRFSKYHLFPYYCRSKYKYVLALVEKLLLKLQGVLGINRIKKMNIEIQKGDQWFSITHNFVEYILLKEEWIKRIFSYSSCCDEMFLQTLIVNSPFKEKLYNKEFNNNSIISIKRYIDWNRGIPYVFRKEDFDILMNSEALFARKFDLTIDKEIVEMIYKKLLVG